MKFARPVSAGCLLALATLCALGFYLPKPLRPDFRKEVVHNCRLLSNAADVYFLEHGEESVSWTALIAPDGYIREFKNFCGESYFGSNGKNDLITAESGAVVIAVMPSGERIAYPFDLQDAPSFSGR